MTTGVHCPQCAQNLSPSKREPCEECRTSEIANPVVRAVVCTLRGRPIRIRELQDKEPGQ
jgi:hypothetical protein